MATMLVLQYPPGRIATWRDTWQETVTTNSLRWIPVLVCLMKEPFRHVNRTSTQRIRPRSVIFRGGDTHHERDGSPSALLRRATQTR
jgi:hypothetical protein